MTAAERLYDSIGSNIENATASQMFGWKCFKIGKKAFLSFENDCMIFKLSPTLVAEAMELAGSYIFCPNKKTLMKNWVCIPYQHKNKWKLFANQAAKKIK